MKIKWSQIGGQLGIGLVLVGALFMFLGWNGSASYDRVPQQFPYLISGGIVGLSLVIVGAAYIVVDNQRRDRALLQNTLAEVRDALDKLALAQLGTTGNGGGSGSAVSTVPGGVVVGPSAYHRPDCRLLEGRGPLPTVAVEDAEDRGLTPCRVCDPSASPESDDDIVGAYTESATSGRRRRRR